MQIRCKGSLSHYSLGPSCGGGRRSTLLRFVVTPRLASLGGVDEGVRPYTSYLRPSRRILDVKALPWQAVKVGVGWFRAELGLFTMTLFTTNGLQRPVMLSKPPRTAQ